MTGASAAIPTLDAYQLRLPTYEGPLDVLLRLIEREQLAISDVSLLAVLDQFIAFVRSLDSPAPDVVAEFATVAGRLSVLKSRALLPQPASVEEEPAEIDLVRQLEEYRAIKLAMEHLADRHRQGNGGFAPGDGIALPIPELPRIVPLPSVALTRAVGRWLARLPQRPTALVPVRVVTLREMISKVFAALEGNRQTSFETMRADCANRQEVIVAFLSILALLRRQAITANQIELFGIISLARSSSASVIETPSGSNGPQPMPEPERLRA